jgi:putative hydroxymethylpyrimidine transport system ATP-binding protein
MLKIDKFNLTYQQRVLFDAFGFEIASEEWVVLLGQSGVGKTSLLRMIAALPLAFSESNTEIQGEVYWQGKKNILGNVAYMAQQDGLFPWLSVLDNVLIPLRLQGRNFSEEEAKKLLVHMGLKDFLRYRPGMLSGGMRQRVALARTLVQDKPILLMDEPFSALDALTRLEMQNLLFTLVRPLKKLLIMVTHDPWEALKIADRVIVLSGAPVTITYTVQLPKSLSVRELTPELLERYQEILSALGRS